MLLQDTMSQIGVEVHGVASEGRTGIKRRRAKHCRWPSRLPKTSAS